VTHAELSRILGSWNHRISGKRDSRTVFSVKVVDHTELSRDHRPKIHFVTIRCRGAAILRDGEQQPTSAWKLAVIDIPKVAACRFATTKTWCDCVVTRGQSATSP
jgi:hypothetical protein